MRYLIPAVLMMIALVACGPRFIDGTEVEDTGANKEIFDIVENYRQAIEQRDVEALKSMISRRYFSNAGTTSESVDDYGYEQLERKVLPLLQENIKSLQYTVFLRNVRYEGENRAVAEFEYYYKFFYVEDGKDRWSAKNDFARLEFAKEDGVWRIISGL